MGKFACFTISVEGGNMAVTDENVVDGIAFDNEGKTLIMEIYDHLDFEGKFEFDHISILQDKLNTYLWYIDSRQYVDVYPDKQFENFVINVHFRYAITENCKKYIDVSNQKLSASKIKIVSCSKVEGEVDGQ